MPSKDNHGRGLLAGKSSVVMKLSPIPNFLLDARSPMAERLTAQHTAGFGERLTCEL